MTISILTLFPSMFTGPMSESIVKRAVGNGIVDLNIVNIRDFATDKHRTTDLPPYGGGPGMVMMIEPIQRALESLQPSVFSLQEYTSQESNAEDGKPKTETRIVLMSAKGHKYTQAKARDYSSLDHLVLICGHYEGVDERVREHLCDEEIRIGDYVLTGGELPAMVIADSVIRLLPGALGDDTSSQDESHSSEGTLEYPQYTRPADYKGWTVPEVLLGGNHAEIEQWRRSQQVTE